jgi:fucose permease
MQLEWGLPLDAVGLVSIFITGSTIISSLLSGRIIRALGTGKVIFISCLMTGAALLGMSYTPSYLWLIPLAIPLGFGAGSVDTALNNYVALHFKAHHMNWLHSFWGVGATLGPLIMANTLSSNGSWRYGYRTISMIQLSLAALLFISLPLWLKHHNPSNTSVSDSTEKRTKPIKQPVFRIKGIKYALATFLFYCTIELSVGLWGSSYLIEVKHITIEKAASWVAMYYAGITAGRFISGFVSFKLNNTQMIRIGVSLTLFGIVLLLLPLPRFLLFTAFILIGLGLSPIFPAMIHETPRRFGSEQSQDIIGYQMAFAYIGTAFLPPLFGILVKHTTMNIFPVYLLSSSIAMILCTERLAQLFKKNLG